MRAQAATFAAAVLPALVAAVEAPVLGGLNLIWSDSFAGKAGDSVDTSKWDIAQGGWTISPSLACRLEEPVCLAPSVVLTRYLAIDTNQELQSYTDAGSNLQISGGGTVQFVPVKSSSGHWTSGRIESKASWTPAPGKIMQVEASARLGDAIAAQAQGMWPAIWMMGDSIHHGTQWPACGEIDIFESVNKDGTAYGTLHCTASACRPNGAEGLQGSTATDNDWHSYAVKIDRTSNDWTTESISFMKDGVSYFSVSGATIGDEAVWASLAHSPVYLIMNVAVGGSWPGDPNAETMAGYGNMLEVEYAAVYSS